MAKTLLLIRHAKSDWADLSLPDFQRPLNSRGERNAPTMARRLIEKELFPQQLISSPALRAITTAKHFAMELQIKLSNIIQEPEIYDASSNTLLDLVNHLDENSDFTALFGHNPGISGLVNYLCDPIALHMPTCGMVLIKFPFNKWNLLSKGTGELIFFDFPKNEHI